MSSPSPPDDVGSGVGSGFGVDGAGVSGRGVDGLGVDGTGVSGRGVDGFGVDGAGVSGRGVGFTVGLAVGFAVGLVVGFAVGLAVGFAVSFGFSVGVGVSSGCGVSEGAGVPEAAGVSVGAGAAVGVSSGVGSGSAANSASSEVSGSHAPPSASYSTMPALKRTGGSASFGSSYTVSSAGVLPAPGAARAQCENERSDQKCNHDSHHKYNLVIGFPFSDHIPHPSDASSLSVFHKADDAVQEHSLLRISRIVSPAHNVLRYAVNAAPHGRAVQCERIRSV